MMKPNFFIVGAPKCGTTAMADYLRTHPHVFISADKEPHFFAEDIPNTRGVSDMAAYMQLFAGAGPQHTVIGEASTRYLMSTAAPALIAEFNPAAFIVAMLRNPVDLVYSLHSQQLYDGVEDEPDFETAWRIQSQRPERRFLQYAEAGRLGFQVQRLLETFPRRQVHFVLFDDFRKNTRGTYVELLAFLGLPDDGRVEFPVVNENKKGKRDVTGLSARVPGSVMGVVQRAKAFLGVERIGFFDLLQRFSTRVEPRPPMSSALRVELTQYFREDVELLSNLIGRDLSHWSEVAGRN